MNWSGNHPKTLAGIRVLDMTRLLPGPFCTMLLADLGAEVIKIEAPQGGDYARWYPPMSGSGEDAMSAFFASINRGKRSVSINLKDPKGAEILRKLAAQSDVVVETFRPGVMDRLGIGPERLCEDDKALIYCAITGFGQTGPYRLRAGHDLTYISMGGALEQTALKGTAPHPPGFQLADVLGGGVYGALSILAALYHRLRTGEGSQLDISMTDGAATVMAPSFARVAAGAGVAPRGDDQLTGGIPSYMVYETADGKYMALAALEPKFWNGFCATVERPDWLPKGYAPGETVTEIAALFRTKTRQEWTDIFAEVDVCCEPVLDPGEAIESDLLKARDLFFKLGHPGKTETFQTATPITPRDSRLALRPPPLQGEHTESVMLELGLDADEIKALLEAGTLK